MTKQCQLRNVVSQKSFPSSLNWKFNTNRLNVLSLSKEALDSYDKSKAIMVDPRQTYRGIPYYFGIDPVSTNLKELELSLDLSLTLHLVLISHLHILKAFRRLDTVFVFDVAYVLSNHKNLDCRRIFCHTTPDVDT